ncbi:MAG TPA: GAF domain-containing sensor histidine kinase [Ktedonobacteraceae bacterium]|nr:GAF domain-containing sensor histidine kinase [Ktedonobacteraceae bacterium]
MPSVLFPEGSKSDELFQLLQNLLALPAMEVDETIYQTTQLITQAFHAEKVDVFLYDPGSQNLIAVGTSVTPMGIHEKNIGLDRISLAQGGRAVEVYLTEQSYWTGQTQHDPQELTGIKEELGIKSEMLVPLFVETKCRGVLFVSSSTPHSFEESDLRLLEAVANWVGIAIYRAELNANYAKELADHARRLEAEELLVVMAHDLHNYLTPLKGRLDLLRRRATRERQSSYARELEVINQSMLRLNRLVSDLLDIERLKQGMFALHCQSVNLVEIIESLVPIWDMPEHPIQVQAPVSVVVKADFDRIQQVIENLLSNATTHADPGTPVQVVVAQTQRTNSLWALITITNQGPRLSPEQLERLFQPFSKGTRSQGLGLGLYISRRIAEAHQGTLTAQTEGEKAMRMTFSLPCESLVSPTI